LQFVDEARITVRGGRGGDGCVSFNREKFKPKGGPDGGHGGDGGSVYLVADENVSTLEPYAYRRVAEARRGIHGSGGRRVGRSGEDNVLEVPVGTLVYDENGLLADLDENGSSVLVVRGGEGGRGNASFATSTRQAPGFREKGLPGEEKELRLELRFLSDVGLVGLPNAGKSSLLSALSAARPKVGDYPFTTLTPALGVVEERAVEPFVVADVPGIISGASEGRGLGNRFLRHVGRARILALVLDGSENPEDDEAVLRAELESAGLSGKFSVVVVNKLDLLDEEIREYLRGEFPEALFVSAVTGEGLDELRDTLRVRLEEAVVEPVADGEEHRIFRPGWKGISVEEEGEGGFVLSGAEVERLFQKTDWENQEAVEHFQYELERLGISAALRRAGAEPGDEVRIGERIFEFR
jgi:GTP-binding protein